MSKSDTDQNRIDAVTGLILATFRLNGRLLEAGDALVAPLGLTSARWQVLGAINASHVPLPVAHVARNMGLSRQSVQRLANAMARDRLVRFADNPHHASAKLVLMTTKGRDAYRAAMALQRRWAATLTQGIPADRFDAASGLLNDLSKRLDEAS